MSLRTSAHTGVAIRSPAAAQTEKQRLWRIRNCLRTHPGTTLLHPRTPAHLLHVIARSGAAAPRRDNPFSLRQHKLCFGLAYLPCLAGLALAFSWFPIKGAKYNGLLGQYKKNLEK